MLVAASLRHARRAVSVARVERRFMSQRTVVLKFGGSSVGSAKALASTADALINRHAANERVVAVLSAMYGVTNKLVGSVNAAVTGDEAAIKEYRTALWSLHEDTCKELLSNDGANSVLGFLEASLAKDFDQRLKSISEKGAFDDWDMDVVSCLGERYSTRILAQHIRERNLQSEAVQADTIITTDGVPGDSSCDLPATRKRIGPLAKMLDDRVLPCVTGFLGLAPDGRVTTFGRGGSDVTATVLANVLNAQEVCLMKVECTDKNGRMVGWEPGWIGVVHDADPNHTVEELTYAEAAELAFWGKKVLHTHTTSYVENEGIPIRVGSSYDPTHRGTLIGVPPSNNRALRAFTSLSLSALQERLSKATIKIGNNIAPDADLVAVAGVGHQISSSPAALDDMVNILKSANIASEPLQCARDTGHSHAVLVDSKDKKPALKALYAKYFQA